MMVKKSASEKRTKFGHYSKKRQKNHCFKKKNFKKRASLALLQRAIESRFTTSVASFLPKGLDINAVPKFPEPLLHTAVRASKYKVVQQLIDAGADVNLLGKLPNSCCHPRQFLVPNPKIQCPSTPLIIAVEKGKEKMVKLLIQNKADPNINSCNGLALDIAVEKGIFKIVKLLLRAGADVNASNSEYKPLHTAISKNNYIMVKYLIKWKANVNILGRNAYDINSNLYTPLQLAIFKKNIKIIRLLINNKARIDVRGSEESLLHFSLRSDNPEIVSFCAINTIDVNAVNSRGESALHVACERQNITPVLKILLDAGVDVNLKDIRGFTALERCHDHFGRMLENLKQHVVKLRAAGVFISDEVLRQFREVDSGRFSGGSSPYFSNFDNFDYEGFFKKCSSEIEVMKTIYVAKTSISFYQVLHRRQHRLALLLMDVAYEDFYSQENLRLKFPIYGGMIFYKLSRAFNEKKSFVVVDKALHYIFKREFPDLIKRRIYGYFSYGELTMLTKM